MNARAIRGAACCAVTVSMLFIGTAGASAAGLTYTVTGFGDGIGSCNRTTCTTLRAALASANANPGSTITLGAGTYTLNAASGGALDLDTTGTVSSGDALTITGTGPTQTVIEQTSADRGVIFASTGGPYLLSGVEVTGGSLVGFPGADANGAGVNGNSSVVDLDDVLVTGNSVVGGNGEANTNDSGGWGYGAGFADSTTSAVTINDSTITGNSATGGAGASNSGAAGGEGGEAFGAGLSVDSVTISNSTISDNIATGGSGGSSSSGAAPDGGLAEGAGLGGQFDTVILFNTTVTGNTANGGAVGTGTQAGTPGEGFGGGIGAPLYGDLYLFSDTITGNSATGADGQSYGGNLAGTIGSSDLAIEIGSTVIGGGVAADDNDCDLPPAGGQLSYFDLGHNLEDDAANGAYTQCQPDGKAATDMAGVSPKLGPLAANGGPTETELPQAGSPLIGAGGACEYLETGTTPVPLPFDQRGDPRGSVCDTGAVQLQGAAATGTPQITGTPVVGDTLTCSAPSGTFSGDELSYTYAWLLDGAAIPGATSTTYNVTATDAGQQVACKVTAIGLAGTAVDVASPAVAIPAASASSSPTPTPTPSPGTIELTATRLSYAHGKVKFELRCTGGQTGCSGRYELYVVKHHGKKTTDVVLAKGTYSLTSGKTKTTNAKPKLSESETAALRKRHGKLSTVLQLTPSGGKASKTKTTIEG